MQQPASSGHMLAVPSPATQIQQQQEARPSYTTDSAVAGMAAQGVVAVGLQERGLRLHAVYLAGTTAEWLGATATQPQHSHQQTQEQGLHLAKPVTLREGSANAGHNLPPHHVVVGA